MTLGVLTEKGIFMAQAPTITNYETGIFSFRRKTRMNQSIVDLIKGVNKIKLLDEQKGRKSAK